MTSGRPGDKERLRAVAEAIQRGARHLPYIPGDEDQEAPEGRLLLRWHRSRERSQALVKRKKKQALAKEGVLRCEVCDFVFADLYGEGAAEVIDCHHLTPLSELEPGTKTTLNDLALVCANCHWVLHLGGGSTSVATLRETVARNRARS